MHGGSGVGDQTAAAALISGRGISPGRAGGAGDRGDAPVDVARAGKRRDKEERLRGAQASISISLNDHAERVSMKAQRIRDGTWPSAGPAAPSAKEKLAALRERVRARAAGALGAAEARLHADDSDNRGQGGGGTPSDMLPLNIGGDDAQHRGKRQQLDDELHLELRVSQANEASQIHSGSRIGGGAGGACGDAAGGEAGSYQAAELTQRSAGWGGSQSRGAAAVGLAGTAIRTATTVAASLTAWHSDAAETTP